MKIFTRNLRNVCRKCSRFSELSIGLRQWVVHIAGFKDKKRDSAKYMRRNEDKNEDS